MASVEVSPPPDRGAYVAFDPVETVWVPVEIPLPPDRGAYVASDPVKTGIYRDGAVHLS